MLASLREVRKHIFDESSTLGLKEVYSEDSGVSFDFEGTKQPSDVELGKRKVRTGCRL